MKEALLLVKGISSGALTENNIIFTPYRLLEVNLPFIDATGKVQYFTEDQYDQAFTVKFPVSIEFEDTGYYCRTTFNATISGSTHGSLEVTPVDPSKPVRIIVS